MPRRTGIAAVLACLLLAGCAPAVPAPVPDTAAGPATPSPGTTAPTGAAAPSPAGPTPDAVGREAGCPGVRCASLLLTGDLLLHEKLWDQAAADAAKTGNAPLDFGPMLAAQRKYVAASDLAVCHLETPVGQPRGPFSAYPSFNVPPQILTAVKDTGYDACTTASNHSLDAGTAGVKRTLDTLDKVGLAHTGSYRSAKEAAEVHLLQAGAVRIAIVAGTYALNGAVPEHPWQVDALDTAAMTAKARRARAAGADLVVAAMHAGDEYSNRPNSQQRQVAHALAESGEFDLVYGHHSHSVQPIEKYHRTWIVYGLGNTLAAHATPNVLNTEGLMVRARFSQAGDGAWSVSRLAWVPATWDGPKHRWCPLALDAPAIKDPARRACVSAGADAASRARTKATVESLGAAKAGAAEWLISQEP
ncbi:CapA family protein [Arthrobacter sp. I2-34]|uniref:CapA family protein n=1 Tax=Arthrobacter hankyongi TaxID=2904801 RepID=A0ABS9LD49_9MICC|nr:CapA family protein [Arthrobacter hankyongi]MCG2624612.1 CapA family protein [Arthrobacter hankyongi]